MTNRERMIAGQPYDSSDPDLVAARRRARALCHEFNTAPPDDDIRRQEIFRHLVGTAGAHFVVEAPFRCDYGFNITWGEGAYANFDCIILDCAPVVIGRGVLLGPRVQILTATHPVDPGERASGLESASPVSIGDNVWIGAGAIINPGVTIGAHTVIGSGSVVTKSIPDRVLAAGNPCTVIREL